jgi:hypothetical protein
VEGKIEAVISVTIDDVEKGFKGAVFTIEDVGAVTLAIFKSIGTDVENLFEWLVTELQNIFNWELILQLQGYLSGFLTSAISVGNTVVNDYLNNIVEDVQSYITTYQATFDKDFDSLVQKYFGMSYSALSTSTSSSSPSPLLKGLSMISDVQSNWLLNKIRAYLDKILGSDLLFDDMEAAFDTFLSTAEGIVDDELTQELNSFYSYFISLLSNPENFFQLTISEVLLQIKDFIDLVLTSIPQLIEAFVAVVQAMFEDIEGFFTGSLNIPILSQILDDFGIVGTDIKVIDCICLILAVPALRVANIINLPSPTASDFPALTLNTDRMPVSSSNSMAAIAGTNAFTTPVLSSEGTNLEAWLFIFTALGGLTYTFMDGLNDSEMASTGAATGPVVPVQLSVGTEIGLQLLALSLKIISTVNDPNTPTEDTVMGWTIWFLQNVPITLDILGAKGVEKLTERSNSIAHSIWGMTHFSLYCLNFILDVVLNPKEIENASYTVNTLTSMGSCVPEVAKLLQLTADPAAATALVVIDGVFGVFYYVGQFVVEVIDVGS